MKAKTKKKVGAVQQQVVVDTEAATQIVVPQALLQPATKRARRVVKVPAKQYLPISRVLVTVRNWPFPKHPSQVL